MDEDLLRETLADPATRAQLLAALEPKPKAFSWRWAWAGLAVATLSVSFFLLYRPKPQVDLAQIRQNTAPEPQSVPIETPKSLTLSDSEPSSPPRRERALRAPERNTTPQVFGIPGGVPGGVPDRRPMVGGVPGGTAGGVVGGIISSVPHAAPPPPPPPPSVQRMALERADAAKTKAADEAVAVSAEATAVTPAPPPLRVQVLYQQPDQSWLPLEAGKRAPAGRPLRLSVSSPTAGILSVANQEIPLPANRLTTIDLPAATAGDLNLELLLYPARRQGLFRRSLKAVPNQQPLLRQNLQIRVE